MSNLILKLGILQLHIEFENARILAQSPKDETTANKLAESNSSPLHMSKFDSKTWHIAIAH
jgi:hypothetical protein